MLEWTCFSIQNSELPPVSAVCCMKKKAKAERLLSFGSAVLV